MIDRTHALPLTRPVEVPKPSRSSVHCQPRVVSPADLAVMRRRDELHLQHPFAGRWMLRDLLAGEGIAIGRRRVAAMMRRMAIEAIHRRPNTSKAAPGNKIHPDLLRGPTVGRPDRVWAMDITCLPMARGFVYLAVVLDWFSRRVLAWQVSIDAAFLDRARRRDLVGRSRLVEARDRLRDLLVVLQEILDAEPHG